MSDSGQFLDNTLTPDQSTDSNSNTISESPLSATSIEGSIDSDIEEINRSQYDAAFAISSSDPAPICFDSVPDGSDLQEEIEVSSEPMRALFNENARPDEGNNSPVELAVQSPMSWVRVTRGKRAGSIAVKIDENTIVTHDQEGRALQLHPNVTVDLLDLRAVSAPPYLALLAYANMEELGPFMQSYVPHLLTYVSPGPSPALATGDRIVVVAGRYANQSGFIVQIFETVVDGKDTLYAKVIPSIRGAYNPNFAGQAIYPKLSNVRRHGLDFSYPFRCRDRVIFDGTTWHVHALDTETWTLSLSNAAGTIHGVAMDQVRREWRTGDMVRVRWGVFASRTGFITRIHSNGTLQILDPCHYSMPTHSAWLFSHSFLSRAADVDVDPNDPIMGLAAKAEAPYDLVQSDMKGRGSMYHGVRIQVIGQGITKGLKGVIVGDHDGKLRVERIERARIRGADAWRRSVRNHHGILLTVQKDASNERFQDIPIEDVLHESTSTPLLEARHLPMNVLKNSGAASSSTMFTGAFPAEHPRPRSTTPPPNEEDTAPVLKETVLDGELDGSWLNIRNLVNKRLDVHLYNISSHIKTVTKKALNAEGRFGHLLLTDSSIDSAALTVYGVGPTSAKITLPKICMRPRRASDDALPLTVIVERVVVLGPAVDGDNSRLGEYAQTIGDCGHGLGKDVVGVRFEKGLDLFFYHTAFLCLAKNIRIQSTAGLYDTTAFN